MLSTYELPADLSRLIDRDDSWQIDESNNYM